MLVAALRPTPDIPDNSRVLRLSLSERDAWLFDDSSNSRYSTGSVSRILFEHWASHISDLYGLAFNGIDVYRGDA
jgi:hypothetical protein